MPQKTRFLAELGQMVLGNGYPIVPIEPGSKRPPWDEWQKTAATPALLRKWVANGQAESGIGILAATVPGCDLDIRDIALAREMQQWVQDNIGWAPVRFGEWPKRLLMFRTDAPFRKVMSRDWLDPAGNKARVEILGDGQQYVSHHIHPDTQAPYKWTGGHGPHDISRDDLTEITAEDAQRIVARFEERAQELGWTPKARTALAPLAGKPGSLPRRGEALDADDWTSGIDLKGPIGMGEEEMRRLLQRIPVFEDYPGWLGICAAIKHEFQDDPATGLELFVEYSERCSNFDERECREKWASFRRNDESGAKTARWILALAKEADRAVALEQRVEIETLFRAADSVEALAAAAEQAKSAPFDKVVRGIVAARLREAFKRVTGTPLGIRESREMVRFEDPARGTLPDWLKPWVYCSDDNTFYRRETGTVMSPIAFNAAHARLMLSRRDVLEGRAHPELLPADAALNLYQIPVVQGRMYLPSEDDLFTLNGVAYVNTYSDRSVPEVPDKLTPQEQRDVERAKRHFHHLFPNKRERELVISWLAFIVQTQRRPNWSLLIQGVEGDGKTWIHQMMGAVLGAENVRAIDGALLESAFTSWAEGSLLNTLEEIRLHGHSKFEILNRLKPFITNATVQVHRKGRDAYVVPNTAGYMALTNYRDALPVGEADSRYFMAFSQWQTGEAIRQFKKDHPTYYPELYRTLERSAGALRKWLLEVELHPEFDPAARAPESAGRAYAVEVSKSDEVEGIEEVLAVSKAPDVSRDLLNATALADLMADTDGLLPPQTRAMRRALHDLGFTYLGKFRVEGRYCRYWSQNPRRFEVKGQFVPALVRAYLARGGL
jgi:hypothetical protein